jgi:subtilisin family serine protease
MKTRSTTTISAAVAAAIVALGLSLSGCAALRGTSATEGEIPSALRTSPDRLIVVTVANDTTALASRAGSTPRGYDGLQGYSASSSAREMVASIARDYHLNEVAAWPIPVLKVHCVVFEIPETSTRDAVLADLAREPRVKLAQPLATFQTMSNPEAGGYNDPYVSLQHGFEQIDVADAHRWSRGDGVRVAIIDTGVDIDHPELKHRVVATHNFVDDNREQFRSDRHGTEVAGVIASIANNNLGIVGVAPGVRIIALKACWQLDPAADTARCNSFTVAKALVAAMDEGAQVVNLSLAGPADPLLSSLVESGIKRGIVYVGSVSPAPLQGLTGFPGGTAGMLVVDSSETHTARDNALLAPGSEILTLTPGGHFDFATGSSLATAHVTGTVALLLAQDSKLGPDDLQRVLSNTSTRSINACAAVASVRQKAGCTPDSSSRVSLR